ncbi:DUF418 domain-containing protein [Agrococcus sp. Marseille-P2731]|uniref:DUF418 domain-containing protein n=1 Tax=Agrococcus sp. Marseille-P2731 TaxID=1841862 RepID=UPI000AAD7FD7|nr:DUF418 domain-containing protein [Agrococcus sp. Marseille-P2731]
MTDAQPWPPHAQPGQQPWPPHQAVAPHPHLEVDRAAAATAARGRSLAPDLARGLMLLLIALANVPWWLYGAEHGLTNAHGVGHEGADLGYQLFSLVAIDGRAYPLFAFLFGYGIWQLYSRQSAAGTPWRAARRLLQLRHLWMLAFGAVHALLLWFGDIVGAYGLTGLIVAWLLLRRSDRALKIVAWVLGGLLLVFGAFSLVSAAVLSSGVAGDLADFGGVMVSPAGESSYPLFMLASFGTWLLATPGQVIALTVPLATVLGILAARRGLLDRPHEHRATLTRIAVGGILIGWAGGALAALQFAGALFDPAISWGTMGVSSLAGVAGGIGYAALFGLIAAAIGDRRGIVTRTITAVGKRSLSSYLLQSVLFAPILAAWGFGLGATISPIGAAGLAVGVWLVTAIVAVILDLQGKRGPAEALLRRLAYGKRQVAAPSPLV